ncbi:AAA family ATPase [Candidatus Poseidonia alphae]|nr:AAA family ATPase [Candidatus Poseidonia alphae]
MNIPFIYKYKPENFSDFEIQAEIIEILHTLISMNNLNILFIGDSGSGKTALISTLVKEYYGKIPNIHENILEINSLKEQGIQYYRTEVKTFCQTRCSIPSKKKIVILDDIDNINEQSQQVFRNCIDKYKNNVHFISSCSNIQKVIDSLQSRKIIIKLKPLHEDQFLKILNRICLKESITLEPSVDKFVISLCNGSIRILLNYLEKFKIINQKITISLADNICTNISFSIFDSYTNFIVNNDLHSAIDVLYNLYDKGYSVMDIYDNYLLYIKPCTFVKELHKYEIIKLLCKYITIFHNIHEDEIELALFTNNLNQLLSN